MAFLQITSTNPNLSYLIKKNPTSGLVAKKSRKGHLFGYFSFESSTQYNVYFRDSFTEISYPEYKDQQFEYINATRYSSAQFSLTAISEFFRDAFKKRDVELDPDDTYTTTLSINMVKVERKRILYAFINQFSSICTIAVDEVAHKTYRIRLTTHKSLFFLLNVTNLLMACIVIHNKTEYYHLDEGTIEKYLSALTVIDAPYFIRYHLKTSLLRDKKYFAKYKTLLEKSEHSTFEMCRGDSSVMRLDMIKSKINFSNHIVDVGCGDAPYLEFLTKRMLQSNRYFAIDVDAEQRSQVTKRVRIKSIPNVTVLSTIDEFLATSIDGDVKVDFLLSEVIEHMSLEEAETIISKCLNYARCNSVIITTPNYSFNQFFFDAGEKEFRHLDHKFEFTAEDFKTWISKFLTPHSYEFIEIGDKVNGISISLGAFVQK